MPDKEPKKDNISDKEQEIAAKIADISVNEIAQAGIKRLELIEADSQLPPREGETIEEQAARLAAERRVVLGMLGRFGILPDHGLLEPEND